MQYCLATVHTLIISTVLGVFMESVNWNSPRQCFSMVQGLACAPDAFSSKCFGDGNPVWRRRGELSSVCELCPATWPQDREQVQDCCTSQQRRDTGLTAVLYSRFFFTTSILMTQKELCKLAWCSVNVCLAFFE